MLLNVSQVDYQNFSYSLSIARRAQELSKLKKYGFDLFAELVKQNNLSSKSVKQEQYLNSKHFDKGGFVRFQGSNSWAIFVYPVFKFRPCQSDVMHFDLWTKGINVLLDSGTYSYNTTEEFQNYFKSVTAHNTVQIDGLEQMRSVSRFLYSDWPKAKNIEFQNDRSGSIIVFSCEYKHFSGATHHRKIQLKDELWVITDTLVCLKDRADLFWHMPLLEGKLDGHSYQNEFITLTVECDQPNIDITLNECWISKYYQHKEKALVIKAFCENVTACQFVTTIKVM